MITITAANYEAHLKKPKALAGLFANNQAVIGEMAFDAFKLIWEAIKEAIQNGGHFRRDVRSYINLDQQYKAASEKRILELEQRVSELETNQ